VCVPVSYSRTSGHHTFTTRFSEADVPAQLKITPSATKLGNTNYTPHAQRIACSPTFRACADLTHSTHGATLKYIYIYIYRKALHNQRRQSTVSSSRHQLATVVVVVYTPRTVVIAHEQHAAPAHTIHTPRTVLVGAVIHWGSQQQDPAPTPRTIVVVVIHAYAEHLA